MKNKIFQGILLTEFDLKARETLKIHRVEHMGSYYFDIRIFLTHGNLPTNKGFRIPETKLADLFFAFNDAINKLKKN